MICEKEFTIVMYGDKKFNDKGIPDYTYSLVGEGTSAKCPPDIFGAEVQSIPNDNKLILDKILEFVK